jgi:hypothetical protein
VAQDEFIRSTQDDHGDCYWFGRFCRRVELVTTTVDADVFSPVEKAEGSPFIVGWTRTSGIFDTSE